MQLSAVLIVKDVSTRPHTEIIPETFIQMQNQECWKNLKLELVNAKILAPTQLHLDNSCAMKGLW